LVLDDGSITVTEGCVETLTLTGTNTDDNEISTEIGIAGTGVSVNKTGSGLWRLSGASTYTGQLTVSDGTIVVASNVSSDSNSPFGVANTLNSPYVGSSAAGSGTAALLAAGGVTIDAPFYVAALGAGSSQVAVLGATTGTGNASSFGSSSVYVGRDLTLQASTGVTATFNSNWRNSGNTGPAAVGFTIGSSGNAGTVVLASSLGSATFVNVVAGTARLSFLSDLINPAAPVTIGSNLGSATLDLNGLSQTLTSTLAFAGNSGSITGGTLRLASTPAVAVTGTGHTISSLVALDAAAGFNVAAAGRLGISSAISGSFGLTKTGVGILELTGTSSYTGATSVSAGSLLVNGWLTDTAVTVQSGGLLGGSGTISGFVNVLSGGTFSPGNSPGLITTGSLSLDGTTLMEIDGLSPRGGVSGYDAVNVTGLLNYGGGMVIDFGSLITLALPNDTTFDLFDFGSSSGLFTSITTATDGSFYSGLTFTGTGNKWTATKDSQTLEFTHSTGILVIVPDPAAIALAGIGIAAAAWALRRRRA